jgi:hypothetical protein
LVEGKKGDSEGEKKATKALDACGQCPKLQSNIIISPYRSSK